MAARLTPTGNPGPTSTCSPATATSGLMTTKSSKRAATSSSIWACIKPLPPSTVQSRQLEQMRNILAHLVLPIRPVVAALRTPVVQRVADSFAGKNFGEAVRGRAVFPRTGAGGNVNVATGNLLIEPEITRVGKVIDGIVEIKIVVVHAIHEVPQVVDPGHRETTLDHVGMLKETVRGVVRAEGSAHGGDGDARRLTVVPDEGHDLFAQVGIEKRLDVAAMKWVHAFVVKAEPVDGIDAEEFDFSPIDEIRKSTDHALPFEFPLITRAGGKAHDRRAPVAVDNDTQFHAQPVRVPAVIFTFHRLPLGCCGEKRVCQRDESWAISLPAEKYVLRASASIICDGELL